MCNWRQAVSRRFGLGAHVALYLSPQENCKHKQEYLFLPESGVCGKTVGNKKKKPKNVPPGAAASSPEQGLGPCVE